MYRKAGHWSPGTIISPLRNFSWILLEISIWRLRWIGTCTQYLPSPIPQDRVVLLVEAMFHFNIACERWIEWLSMRCYPVQDGAFEALRIISSGRRDSFLYLSRTSQDVNRNIHVQRIYHFGNICHILLRTVEDMVFKAWHHLQQSLKDSVFLPLSVRWRVVIDS